MMLDEWSFDEVGVWPHDLTDEMEDWDIAPCRFPRRPHWMGLEGPPAPLPEIKGPPKDDIARMWEESEKAEREARKKDAEYNQRRQQVNAEKRNNRAMVKAAKEQIAHRLEAGRDGEFEVYVRSGNQYIRWSYRIEDGKAFIHKKRSGWVPPADRR